MITRLAKIGWLTARNLPPAGIALIALTAAIALASPSFLTVGNAENLGRAASVLLIASCAQALIISTGGFDLSTGSAVALMSVVTVVSTNGGGASGYLVGASAVIAASVLVGVLVATFQVPAFIATLGMLAALHGIASTLVGGVPVAGSQSNAFTWPNDGSLLGIPMPVLLALLCLAAFAGLVNRTAMGRAWLLLGANPQAARGVGLPVQRTLIAAFVVSGLFICVAGWILTARVHTGDPNLDPTLAFKAIAACAIGGIPFTGGIARPSQVLIGTLFLAVLDNGLNLLNVPSNVHLIAVGVLTVAAVLTQRSSGVRANRRPITQAPTEASL